jgi:hypothetical protein
MNIQSILERKGLGRKGVALGKEYHESDQNIYVRPLCDFPSFNFFGLTD